MKAHRRNNLIHFRSDYITKGISDFISKNTTSLLITIKFKYATTMQTEFAINFKFINVCFERIYLNILHNIYLLFGFI